jgi:hypothetical protein
MTECRSGHKKLQFGCLDCIELRGKIFDSDRDFNIWAIKQRIRKIDEIVDRETLGSKVSNELADLLDSLEHLLDGAR